MEADLPCIVCACSLVFHFLSLKSPHLDNIPVPLSQTSAVSCDIGTTNIINVFMMLYSECDVCTCFCACMYLLTIISSQWKMSSEIPERPTLFNIQQRPPRLD